jgi:hypothetical protein
MTGQDGELWAVLRTLQVRLAARPLIVRVHMRRRELLSCSPCLDAT